jgi:hypothetical protein
LIDFAEPIRCPGSDFDPRHLIGLSANINKHLLYSIYTVRQVSAFRKQKEILRGKIYEENLLVVVSDEVHVILKS